MKVLPPKSWRTQQGYLKQLLRNPWYRSVANLSSAIFVATHDYFSSVGLKPFVFPITTGSVSSPMGKGSDSLPVKIELRQHEVFLADSMQFSLELGCRLNEGGAYYVMPTFRGEQVDARHLNEFIHSEAEIKGDLGNVIALAEGYVSAIARAVADTCEEDIVRTAGSLAHIQKLLEKNGRFERIRYDSALKELASISGAVQDIGTAFPSITSAGEKELLKRYGDFTWLTHMPWINVPFYQAAEIGTPYSMTADLLAGIGEILGCGQRVFDAADIAASLQFHDVQMHGYEWYAEMHQDHTMQTAGFGLGIERLLLWLTQQNDIRDCALLYRDHDQIFYP